MNLRPIECRLVKNGTRVQISPITRACNQTGSRPRRHVHCSVAHAHDESFSIRPATEQDASQIGVLAEQFAEYLRRLGDPADFNFDAEAYTREAAAFYERLGARYIRGLQFMTLEVL